MNRVGVSRPRATPRAEQTETGTPAIIFDRVGVSYGRGRKATQALIDFSLRVAPGETVALLGPSGSGKSTALNALAGFVRPTSGTVRLDGSDVTDWPPAKRGIGVVLQSYALFPHMRVSDNVAFGLKSHRVPRAEIGPRVSEALDMVGMSAYGKRLPRELSGGQQQRIAIARALAADPSLIVLDEPLASLDASAQAQVANLLVQLSRELSLGLLLISHDLAIVRHTADVVSVMYLGRIVETGQTREVWSAPLHPYTEALIAAVPRPDGSGTMPDALPGEVPDPARPPTGCRFHPRCPYRFSRCPVEEPELEQAFATRTVSCWLPRDPVPTPPSRRTAHTSSTTATNDSSASSSQEEGAMPTHKGGTA